MDSLLSSYQVYIIYDTEPVLNHKSLTLIVLHVMSGLVGLCRVSSHHVVVHESFASEQREASRTTQDTTDHVLGSLLQPMTNSVLEHLVPHHQTYEQSQSGQQVLVHVIGTLFYIYNFC